MAGSSKLKSGSVGSVGIGNVTFDSISGNGGIGRLTQMVGMVVSLCNAVQRCHHGYLSGYDSDGRTGYCVASFCLS